MTCQSEPAALVERDVCVCVCVADQGQQAVRTDRHGNPLGAPRVLRCGGRQVGLPRGNRTLGTEDPTGFRGTARAVRASRHFIVQMRRLVVGGCPTGVSYRLLHDTGHAPTNRKTGPGGERETDRIGSDGPVLLSVP